MENTKHYAIRCSTEEQARECEKLGLSHYQEQYTPQDLEYNEEMDLMFYYQKQSYTIITYKEAKYMGLLDSKEKVKHESKIEELDLDNEEGSNEPGVAIVMVFKIIENKLNEIIRHINKG